MEEKDVLRSTLHKLTGRFMTVFLSVSAILFVTGLVLISLFYTYESVTLQATIEPSACAIVRPEVDGIITALRVRDGDSVTKGQVLVELSSEDLKAYVTKTELDLQMSRNDLSRSLEELRLLQATNENRLQEARLTVRRLSEDVNDQVKLWETSKAIHSRLFNVDSAGSPMEPVDLRAKRASLEQAELALDYARKRKVEETIKELDIENTRQNIVKTERELALAQQKLAHTTICAPQSGRVLGCNSEALPGSFVSEGQQLFRIGDLSGWTAKAYAAETDLPKVSAGLEAKLYVKAYPYEKYRTFSGRVAEVHTSPSTTGTGGGGTGSTGRFYPITIQITDEDLNRNAGDLRLHDGLSAEVKIITKKDRILSLLLDKLFSTAGKLKAAPIQSGN